MSGAGTQYITTDHLGSTRVITDSSKAVVECKDYLPFGDEIIASSSNGRNGIACYGTHLARQKFTGKERDSESRLDYFGAEKPGTDGTFPIFFFQKAIGLNSTSLPKAGAQRQRSGILA
ncbi:MAG: hypothetical protein A3H94_02965 [Acidobacteria bacterium RIFCSPLOWO2_02_FULL_60_20]|nr:MAG: hypothetical protein A3H94_02965 [Acidobacteria bacterium RIFCSPLOWO2_02_FULL_60_20]